MHREIAVAVQFVVSFLYNNIPRRRVDEFAVELQKLITFRFMNSRHQCWIPNELFRGVEYRSLHLSGEHADSDLIPSAANRCGLEVKEVMGYLPGDLVIWIDPGEVTYKIGVNGPVKVVPEEYLCLCYGDQSKYGIEENPWSTDVAKCTRISRSFEDRLSRTADQPLFTVASFAKTKFGTTHYRDSHDSDLLKNSTIFPGNPEPLNKVNCIHVRGQFEAPEIPDSVQTVCFNQHDCGLRFGQKSRNS
ncbi:unnamed protein product [Calicophoron daubneyi]|uniref:Anti-proliferative protein domain-containing protein n=1 Tax=Calicophoron daubneyi TaxID=300641 RepID=A0AAV2T6Z1_CALDB